MNHSSADAAQIPAFKNKSTGLTVFGILLILFSLLLFLLCGLIGLSFALMSTANTPEAEMVNPSTMIPALIIYLLLGILVLILGIGSLLARRWARALILAISWFWLVSGILSIISLACLFLSMLGKQSIPPEVVLISLLFLVPFFIIFFIAIPLALILFYRNPHVKATCEWRDPKERWTDTCPLPVLVLVILMGVWGLGTLGLAWQNWAVPLFGIILSGYQGMLVVIPVTFLFFFTARGAYRLQLWAWWSSLILLLAWLLSFSVTFTLKDYMVYYEAMNYSEEMLKTLRKTADVMQPLFTVLMPLYAIVPLVFLLYIRKYFYPKSPQVNPNISS
jgi:hypothetical protein